MEAPIRDIKALTELCGNSKPGGSPAHRGTLDAIGLSGDLLIQVEDISEKFAAMTGMYVTETDRVIAQLIQCGNIDRIRELSISSNKYYLHTANRRALSEEIQSLGRQLRETVEKNTKALQIFLKRFIPKRR
jgi:hypothetical protein